MSKELEQLKQTIDSIRYIFICDYSYTNENSFIEDYTIEKGTIVELDSLSRHIDTEFKLDYAVVWFSFGRKHLSMPIEDFKFCTKSFDTREIQVD